MKVTAEDLTVFKVVDQIVEESVGGAHRNPASTIIALGEAIDLALRRLEGKDGSSLRQHRREKFLAIGHFG